MKQKYRIGTAFIAVCLLIAAALCFSAFAVGSISAKAETTAVVSRYRAEATSVADALDRANDLNEELMEEGAVLLKNRNKTLPMAAGSKVTVLGKSSVKPLYGGAGSSSGGQGIYDLYDSLHNAGFTTNGVTREFYTDDDASGAGRPVSGGVGQLVNATGETPVASYPNDVVDSFEDFGDAAIVFITRVGGEGFDLSTNVDGVDGRSQKGEHYLELDDNEKGLVALATEHFDKVVVVLNVSTSMELGDLEANDDIGAILWVGLPGGTGLNAIGRLLNGQVTPSGKTVDTYAADFTASPAFKNFANNAAAGNTYTDETGTTLGSARHVVEYDEGIYVGYRYYETRGAVEGEDWYDAAVVYPFGYGLSYTEFEWTVEFETQSLAADGSVDAKVTVTNIGDYPGKDVVELYYSAPYYLNEIEKSHVVLGGFEKTDLLAPGESDTVTVSMPVESMASYDYNDANANDFVGYELDSGTYNVYVGRNAHEAWTEGDSKSYELASGIQYATDRATGTKVENRFDDVSAYFDDSAEGIFAAKSSLMSRADFEGTFPVEMTAEDLKLTSDEINALAVPTINAAYDADQPWYVAEMPTQATTRVTDIQLSALVGKSYDDPLWEDFLDQLTVSDLAAFVNDGFFVTHPIADLGIPQAITPDGPTGYVSSMAITVTNTCFYVAPIVVASTWNKALAERQGEIIGEEGLWGGYNGMYAPATNTHRTPFSGRNFEYYSEDSLLAGKICAAVVKGMQSKGVFALVKHFAVNDQETNRDTNGLVTWADEQTMREIYFKSFEYAVKEGGATGMMSSFNRLGTTWCGASYALLTEVLRNEWGFRGAVITDWAQGGYMNLDQMIRAGNDYYLGMKFGDYMIWTVSNSEEANTPTHVAAMRQATKNVLYTVANSNAMNKLATPYSTEFTAEQLSLGTFDKGDAVTFDASSSGFAGYEYSLSGAPAGLTINKDTGAVSGTIAAAAVSGEYKAVVTLKDAKGNIGQSITLALTVNGGLTYTGVTEAAVGTYAPTEIDVSSSLYGAEIAYAVTDGTLPAGLGLSATGKIVGIPTEAGTSKLKITASATGQTSIVKEVTVTVSDKTFAYAAPTLAEATEGVAFTASAAADGMPLNAVYKASGLPVGLAMDAKGNITGTPAAAGDYTVNVTVSAAGYADKTVQVTLKVKAPASDPVTPEPGEEKGGCGSEAGGTVTLVLLVCLTAFAAFAAVRKAKNDDK